MQNSRKFECSACPRLVSSRTQIVEPTPCPSGGLLVVGEAPGADEDLLGEGFVGQSGWVLDALLSRCGIERNRDYGVANIVRCQPGNNRKPKRHEIESCLPFLADFLVECQPKVLLLVGATATEIMLGPGSLFWHIENSKATGHILLARKAHPAVRDSIALLHGLVSGLHAVPMPHTSGLAWNRKAPNGRRWSEIGFEQVVAASLLLAKTTQPTEGLKNHSVPKSEPVCW